MEMFEEAKLLIADLIKVLKKHGMTEEDIKDGFDEAKKIANELRIKPDVKDFIKKVLDDKKKDL